MCGNKAAAPEYLKTMNSAHKYLPLTKVVEKQKVG